MAASVAELKEMYAASVHRVGHVSLTGEPRSDSGILLRQELPEVFGLPVDRCVSPPFSSVAEVNAAILGRCAGPAADVLTVAELRDCEQIRPAVIETVSVPMVALESVVSRQAEQFSMQQDVNPTPVQGDLANSVAIFAEMPAPLVQPFGVSGIDYGVGANDVASVAKQDEDGALGGGIIQAHRLSPSGGVTSPADLAIGAGIRRVNYTAPLEGEAA